MIPCNDNFLRLYVQYEMILRTKDLMANFSIIVSPRLYVYYRIILGN